MFYPQPYPGCRGIVVVQGIHLSVCLSVLVGGWLFLFVQTCILCTYVPQRGSMSVDLCAATFWGVNLYGYISSSKGQYSATMHIPYLILCTDVPQRV